MFDTIKKLLHSQTLFHPKEDVYDRREGIRPGTDWTIIFSITLFALVCVGLFGWYINSAIDSGVFFSKQTNQAIDRSTTLNQNMLKEFKSVTERRQATSQSIRDNGVPVSDPSL